MERRWIFFHNGKPLLLLVALTIAWLIAAVEGPLDFSGAALTVAQIACAGGFVIGVWLCIVSDRPRKER